MAKTLLHFFSAVGLCVGKKNESVFCALARIFLRVGFFKKFISALALEAVSVVVQVVVKNVQSKLVSSKLAGTKYGCR